MSSAIDFDFQAIRMQSGAAPFHTNANERLLSLSASEDGLDYRQQRAYRATQGDQPYAPDKKGCCGLFTNYGPKGRIIEFVSFGLSLACLFGTFVALMIAFAAEPEHGERPRLAVVRMSKEVLLFTNETAMVHAMRHMQTEYNGFCKKADFKIDLQVPTWNESNAKLFYDGKNSTMYGMSTSVHAGSVSLFFVVFPIYIFSAGFQFVRWYQYCTEDKQEGLYKPWLGPDFSRWLEYLFTSPFQIFIVSTAFGFANRDTVLGLCGMQAALVLFGYDIEQQIKKIYNREELAKGGYGVLKDEVYQSAKKRRFYNLLWPAIRDIRGWVYLTVAWLLHALIWSSIFMRYFDQQRHGKDCGTNSGANIPDVVTFFMISQFLSFTAFGLLNSWQFFRARKLDRPQQFEKWNNYSQRYGVLSITAKLFLEAGFLWYVANARTWPLAKDSMVVHGNMSSGQQCWAVQNK
jgi:hypothetical protein